jgi:hypothetical protein
MATTKARQTMRTAIAGCLLTGLLVLVRIAHPQEPPPYAGGGAAQDGDAAPQGTDAAPAGDAAAAGAEYFHDKLAPYGEWVMRDGYGEVWVPAGGARLAPLHHRPPVSC